MFSVQSQQQQTFAALTPFAEFKHMSFRFELDRTSLGRGGAFCWQQLILSLLLLLVDLMRFRNLLFSLSPPCLPSCVEDIV